MGGKRISRLSCRFHSSSLLKDAHVKGLSQSVGRMQSMSSMIRKHPYVRKRTKDGKATFTCNILPTIMTAYPRPLSSSIAIGMATHGPGIPTPMAIATYRRSDHYGSTLSKGTATPICVASSSPAVRMRSSHFGTHETNGGRRSTPWRMLGQFYSTIQA